ncbi:exodeoxyribonuclease VII large subunit [Oceanobacillus caeni]|uniref:exodeoxyribonuclease VII large subunit n=1 Tax=Oceanobacillus TaxID=182709 RepID=UPI0019572ECF|nr:exodeoxyribonuclease VII large subunit [Oceanobacillus caeni]MBU8789815.1 exodeoxyribonuclease VII large subunit [Oceanobacillus caeni]MCR1834429.1 exodeoxyribonuclease VII large subunit [Oceanobacillus caeni]MED4473412.1 exodeoxyribonuclease VII large subunit [Oceanobacillus caeni]
MIDKYLTVTAVTKYIKRKMDTDPHLKQILIKGEISNFKQHSRGHMYMTIKDSQTKIQAVMFAGNNRFLKFKPENGMNVLIKGEISVYEAYGQYQLYINQMEPDGIGSLYLAFEQLKEKLQKKGYFDPSIKKNIPLYPEHIGVITSPTGAAIRDIITTLRRRYPIVKITVIPVLVQGPNSPYSIKLAIEKANEIGGFDTLIVGRGGGSIEELWSFNEEIVAEAIYRSKIPIISAVGHETDVTISDFVADLRAPTPTGAAEIAVQSVADLKEKLLMLKQALNRELSKEILNHKNHLNRLIKSYAFRYPEQLIKQKDQDLDALMERLQRAMIRKQENKKQELHHVIRRLEVQHPKKQIEQTKKKLLEYVRLQNDYMVRNFENKTNKWTNTVEKLTLLNPLQIMKRGFALPYTENGALIKTIKQVQKDKKIQVRLSDGRINCQVLQLEEDINE